MKYVNALLAVRNAERSKKFYTDLFGLEITEDVEGRTVFSCGFALQEDFKKITGKFTDEIVYRSNGGELCFEEDDLDTFAEKLYAFSDVVFVHGVKTEANGRRVIRLYDPDGRIVEVGESMEFVARRFLRHGRTANDTARITGLPLPLVCEWRKQMRIFY